jgi:hypothetical protein
MLTGMETKTKIAVGTRRASQQSFQGRRIHLVGVGGCGMRALAQMLLDRGGVVSGSDAAASASRAKAPPSPSASGPRISPTTASWSSIPPPSTSTTPNCLPPAAAGWT